MRSETAQAPSCRGSDHCRTVLTSVLFDVRALFVPACVCVCVCVCVVRSLAVLAAVDPTAGATVDLFDDAASTCLELIKGNYYFPFQSSKQYERYKADKKSREEAGAAAAKKKTSACCIL